MKLYTKRGDDGRTDLFGGQRVRKDSLRVEAYGAADELNSVVGLAAVACNHAELSVILSRVQHQLFELGADLATPHPDGEESNATKRVPRIGPAQVEELERWIDQTCAPLPPMRNFVLPGGSELAARLHMARTVCRRVERLCVTLSGSEEIGDPVVIYLNRLSDLFFAMARRANQLEGVADVPWVAPGK